MSTAFTGAIGGAGCGCRQTFTVIGCSSHPLTGHVLNVYDHSGGTLLTTGTTDGSGVVTLTWNGSPSVFVIPAGGRFIGQSLTVSCGGSTTITFAIDTTNYACTSLCADPISKTLHLTDSVLGSATLTYAASQWSGTTTYTYPAYGGCSCTASTVTLTWTLDIFSNLDCSWAGRIGISDACPGNGRPVTFTFSGDTSYSLANSAINCSPFNFSGNPQSNIGGCVSQVSLLYRNPAANTNYSTLTITE
jgi:hypothetical protein